MPPRRRICCRYLEDQVAATGRVPSDEDILIETCRDEMGDRRVCVLTPFGSAVHAPWCMAVTSKLRAERGLEVESMWSNDGFVLRVPDSDEVIRPEDLLPSPAEFKDLVLRQLGSTSLFAAKFREAAGRALLVAEAASGHARTALAAAQTLRRSAGGGFAILFVSPSSGSLSRVHSRRFRFAGSGRYSCRGSARRHSRHHRGIGPPIAVCRVAAFFLRRKLYLRWRRAPGGTPRAGSIHRPVATRGIARRYRSSRTSGFHGAGRSGSPAAIARPGVSRAPCRRRPRFAVEAWRSIGGGNCWREAKARKSLPQLPSY